MTRDDFKHEAVLRMCELTLGPLFNDPVLRSKLDSLSIGDIQLAFRRKIDAGIMLAGMIEEAMTVDEPQGGGDAKH